MVSYSFYESDNRVRRYAEALVEAGHEVRALVIGRPGHDRHALIQGVQVHRLQFRARDERGPLAYLRKLLLFFLRTAWLLSKDHVSKPYDIIHIHSVPDFEVFAALIPRLFGARVILDIHDIVPEFYAGKFHVSAKSIVFRTLLCVERLACSFADHVIISNHLWRDRLIARAVPASKCTAIINYPDSRTFHARESSRRKDGQFVLFYPGSLNYHQGLDIAIEAVAILRKHLPGIRLRIVGEGPESRSLASLATRLSVSDLVTIADPIPLEQVAVQMAEADVGIVPKRADSFGDLAFSTKVMEFMAMGVPVVASRTTVDTYYFDRKTVSFFEPGNAEDLAIKILQLAQDDGERMAQVERARGFIEENVWNLKKREYLDLLFDLAPQCRCQEAVVEVSSNDRV
jgi:glycosyltransferase involved in cell wall biosynthesis